MPIERHIEPRDLVKFLEERGYRVLRQVKSRVILVRADNPVPILINLDFPLRPTTISDILYNAGIPENEALRFLDSLPTD